VASSRPWLRVSALVGAIGAAYLSGVVTGVVGTQQPANAHSDSVLAAEGPAFVTEIEYVMFPPAVAGSEPTGDTPSRSRVARDVGYRRASAWGCAVTIFETQQQPTGEGAVTGWQ